MAGTKLSLNISVEDLERCHEVMGFDTQLIFITGATGFIGKWLLTTLN